MYQLSAKLAQNYQVKQH